MIRSSVAVRKILTFARRPSVGGARDKMLKDVDKRCGGVAGKTLLDVGCDLDGALVKRAAAKYGAKEAIGLNLSVQERQISENCRLIQADARETRLAADSIDLIVSFSAFEHIHEFPRALDELYRVLRPGGLLYAHYGPIWSSPYGHHLWAARFTYWNLVLPPWCHLLMEPAELREFILQNHRLDGKSCDLVVGYVYDAREEFGFSQNKLMYEDYVKIVADSRFRTTLFKGYDNPELDALYVASHETVEALNTKFPAYSNFHYAGIFMILKK